MNLPLLLCLSAFSSPQRVEESDVELVASVNVKYS